MSYTDAIWDREKDIIHVVERDPKKGRLYQTYPARYQFYYPDQKGKFTSIYGESLSKVSSKNWKEFIKEQKIHSSQRLYESDTQRSENDCESSHHIAADDVFIHFLLW